MSSTLEEYIAGTSQNARNTLKEHLEHAAVLGRINDAFGHVLGTLSKNPEMSVMFVGMAHADFLAAARLALGGELPASYAAARACVEDALYGFFLFRKPHLKAVWVAREDDEAAKRRIRAEFKYSAMIKTLSTYVANIGAQLDFAYQKTIDFGAHPNIMKVITNVAETTDVDLQWQYINVQPADVTMAIRMVAMSAIAALNTFRLIWPLTFSSTPGSDIVTEIHDMFLALPKTYEAA